MSIHNHDLRPSPCTCSSLLLTSSALLPVIICRSAIIGTILHVRNRAPKQVKVSFRLEWLCPYFPVRPCVCTCSLSGRCLLSTPSFSRLGQHTKLFPAGGSCGFTAVLLGFSKTWPDAEQRTHEAVDRSGRTTALAGDFGSRLPALQIAIRARVMFPISFENPSVGKKSRRCEHHSHTSRTCSNTFQIRRTVGTFAVFRSVANKLRTIPNSCQSVFAFLTCSNIFRTYQNRGESA